jgi:hypothetical protein
VSVTTQTSAHTEAVRNPRAAASSHIASVLHGIIAKETTPCMHVSACPAVHPVPGWSLTIRPAMVWANELLLVAAVCCHCSCVVPTNLHINQGRMGRGVGDRAQTGMPLRGTSCNPAGPVWQRGWSIPFNSAILRCMFRIGPAACWVACLHPAHVARGAPQCSQVFLLVADCLCASCCCFDAPSCSCTSASSCHQVQLPAHIVKSPDGPVLALCNQVAHVAQGPTKEVAWLLQLAYMAHHLQQV